MLFLRAGIELRIVPKYAVLVDRDPALRREIGGNARSPCDPTVQLDDARMFRLETCHRARKGVAQTRHDLKERQIRISQLGADEVGGAASILLQHPFEIAQVFGRPGFQKLGRPRPRLFALVFVIEAAGYRVMGVVDLIDKVGHRQLQLMGLQAARLIGRRQTVMCAEIEQDVCGLADNEIAGFEKRRGDGRM